MLGDSCVKSCCLVLGGTGNTAGLDATLINTAEDEEVPVHTPRVVPRVGNLPVGSTIEGTPANNADSMAAEEVVGLALVDAGLVGGEVGVDVEGNLKGATGHQLALVTLNSGHRVRAGTEVLGGGGGTVAVAVGLAGGGGVLVAAAGRVGAVDVVGALGEGVGLALSGHQPSADPVGPSSGGVTTVAAATARPAARHEISGRQSEVVKIGSGAGAIRHGGRTTNGPARAAVGLIADLGDGGALGPGGGRVKALGDRCGQLLCGEGTGLHHLGGVGLMVRLNTKKAANGRARSTLNASTVFNGGSPGVAGDLVDSVDHLDSDEWLLDGLDGRSSTHQKCSHKNSAHCFPKTTKQ